MLTEQLEAIRKTYGGEIQISVWADHGQDSMLANHAYTINRNEDGETSDIDDGEIPGYITVIEIS